MRSPRKRGAKTSTALRLPEPSSARARCASPSSTRASYRGCRRFRRRCCNGTARRRGRHPDRPRPRARKTEPSSGRRAAAHVRPAVTGFRRRAEGGGVRLALLALALFAAAALADPIPAGWQASGLRPIGYSDLNGRRGGIKLAIKKVGERWVLYKGGNGIEVVDVTNPEEPRLVKVVPGPKGTAASQLTQHGNLLLLGMSRPITAAESAGEADGWTTLHEQAPADKPFEEALALYDISDPWDTKFISQWSSGAEGSHRNGYPGGRYAYLSTTVPGYRGFILVILDVSDPKNPKEAGRWAYPGARRGEQPGEVTPSYHGPAFPSPDGKM